MGFNFPSSPLVGDTYPVPPVAGVPVYVWDGEKWTMSQLPAVTDVVRYDTAQSLTSAQQLQARANIYAAPYDAMAYSGMQINGGMEVSQEKGNAASTTGYICDSWSLGVVGTSVSSANVGSGSAFASVGFRYSMFIGTSTAQASLGAGDYAALIQNIEGWRTSRLLWGTANAQPITIGFWTSHHRTGIYSVSVRNGPTRSYVFSYTQAVADVPQYNTATIPGCTDGTWNFDNTVGLQLFFMLACGSTFITPSANAWASGNYLAVSGQVNGVGATSDAFRITGLTVLPGTQAPTAAQSPNIMRPYDQELLTCQRYYHRQTQADGWYLGLAYHQSTTAWNGCIYFFPVKMRAVPTIALATASNYSIGAGGGSVACTSILGSGVGPVCVDFYGTCASGLISGQAGSISMNASGFVTCDARL